MTDETSKTETGRRNFLKLAATAPAAAVAATAATAGEAAADEDRGPGLADNAQTRAYYASARF